mgnify:CR=1 FL=1|tara:strand:+ start:2873 stop:3277 length:405 start_codon:yes stop_codon:yes gene_type:complete
MEPIDVCLLDDDLLTRKIWNRVCLSIDNVTCTCFGESNIEIDNFIKFCIDKIPDLAIIDINLDSILPPETKGYVTGMTVALTLIKLKFKGKIILRTAECSDEMFEIYQTCPFIYKVMRKGTSIKKFFDDIMDSA